MESKEMEPGVMRTISGRYVDLKNFRDDAIHIDDIAWGLGRILRYNGHIREDYTVAHHSIIMSYVVPQSLALEALLHDAMEAYMGDMIKPVKDLLPEVERFENMLLLRIMDRFHVNVAVQGFEPPVYAKATAIAKADVELREHECISMSRPGTWHQHIEDAWLKSVENHGDWWWAPQYAFLQRFDMLAGTSHFEEDGNPTRALQSLWFPEDQEVVLNTTDEAKLSTTDEAKLNTTEEAKDV